MSSIATKRIILGLGVVLLIVWMVFSTPFIAWISNSIHHVNIESVDELSPVSGYAFYQLDTCEQTDELFDTIRMSGYIYNISDATDEQTTRSLVLSSNSHHYEIELEEITSWAWRLFTVIDPTPKKETGFGLDFCPLGLPNATYRLLLQVEEDGIPVCRTDTGYILEKVNGHAQVHYRPSQPVSLPEEKELKGWTNGGLNIVEIDAEGTLTLTGWSIIDQVDAGDTEVLVGIRCGNSEEMRVYTTVKESITYIADYFDNDLYYNAGFKAQIPNVTAEGLEIYIFNRYQGETYKCSYHFEPDGSLDNMVSVSDISD